MEEIMFNCDLEPDDERNFLKVEDTVVNIHVTVQHVAYGFWYRLKCALNMLIRGIDANDISVSYDDACTIFAWLGNWITFYKKYNIESEDV